MVFARVAPRSTGKLPESGSAQPFACAAQKGWFLCKRLAYQSQLTGVGVRAVGGEGARGQGAEARGSREEPARAR